MNAIIYAVDFDDTISTNGNYPMPGEPNIALIEWLLERQKEGCKLILWTCREGVDQKIAVDFCNKYGLYFDGVNDNLVYIKQAFSVNSRKIFANYYIDDRCLVLPEVPLRGKP